MRRKHWCRSVPAFTGKSWSAKSAVDSTRAVFHRVKLLGSQDTLFCAPLPEKEREKDGFLGPRGLAPRKPTAQYYTDCEIAGDIDFIFGGGDALFENCVIRTVDNHIPHSYVTAPSGKANGLGFVFWNCDFVSDCPAGSGYLGVLEAYDMTTEAVVAKLMWILGQTRRREEVERLFYTPVARDILWPGL